MVHEEGFRIEKDFQGEWYFQRPDGRAIAHGPIYSDADAAETLRRGASNFTAACVSGETIQASGRTDGRIRSGRTVGRARGGRIEEPMVAYG